MVAVFEREAPSPAAAVGARVDVQGVSHWSGSRANPLQALDDVSLTVQYGEFVALLGPGGCDESTPLRLITGLEPPTRGRILQDDKPIGEPDLSRVMVFQDPTLYPWRRVWDNAAPGLQARGVPDAERDHVNDALRRVGLDGFHRAFPHELLGSMAQRVALARTLVNDPQLLALDEPLGKLDPLTRLAMQSELMTLRQRARFSAVPVTYDVEGALFLAQRVVILSPRPARITAELTINLPYPRHRGGPRLNALRREVLGHPDLNETRQMTTPS